MSKKIKQPVTGGVAKVPVIMQMEALECGAASLAMVIAYYEKWIPLEQVRVDCGVSRDGSNAKNILLAARSYGFEAKGFRYEPKMLRKKGIFPCIIHWNFNHFVVLDGFKNNKAYINDPARGAIKISMEEFDESFTGVCIHIKPAEGFAPEGKKKSTLEFAKNRLKGAGTAVAMVMLTTIITYLFSMINPAMSKVFLDRLLTGKNPEWLYPFTGIMIALAILQLIVQWVGTICSLKINGKMAMIGSTSYMWKVLRLPMEFFSQRMTGDIIQRQSTNASIASTLVSTVAPLVLNTIMMIIYLMIMLRFSVILTFVGIATIVIDLILSRFLAEKRVNVTRVQMRDKGKLSGATVSGMSMAETIKASGAENSFFAKWAGLQASVNSQECKYDELNESLGMLPALVGTLANDVVMLLGVWLAMNGEFTVGGIMTFQGFLRAFMQPTLTLISAGQTVQEMRTDMERVEDVMNYPTDPFVKDEPVSENEDYSKLPGELELRNVTFGYNKLRDPLIKDFSIKLEPGSKVAFVGSSGCGKSTLSKLISGLYRPWSGEILFSGKPIESIDRSVFTGSLAVVDQDIILFEDTIANNIKMWDNSIKDYEMVLAARDAQLHEDIMQRDGGYQYRLTEGGKDFSGGQRQRLEIARVLAQDPSLIILDEATSALDAKTEYDVVKAIKDRGITCIVIAHRLSTIRDCDEIVVLDKGEIVERGTHEELMKMGGYYTELVTSE